MACDTDNISWKKKAKAITRGVGVNSKQGSDLITLDKDSSDFYEIRLVCFAVKIP